MTFSFQAVSNKIERKQFFRKKKCVTVTENHRYMEPPTNFIRKLFVDVLFNSAAFTIANRTVYIGPYELLQVQ